ncbi:MAG: hypothetical protein MJ209_06305 [archaeon]|nr:hypothetical protein [archaeon]
MRKDGKSEEEIEDALKNTVHPEGAMLLDDTIDILFEGIENGDADIIIGEDAMIAYNLFCTDRGAFDEVALDMGMKRRKFYDRAQECERLGIPVDVQFPS